MGALPKPKKITIPVYLNVEATHSSKKILIYTIILNEETETIIIISVFSAAWLVVFVMAVALCVRLASLRRTVLEMQATNRIRVQKLKINKDKNHSFHNPALSPDEELSRRGYSMYEPDADVWSGRHSDRQTGGQLVEELSRELDARQQRQAAPPFLLQAIEENKRKSRGRPPANPHAHSRQSDTNPNFIY